MTVRDTASAGRQLADEGLRLPEGGRVRRLQGAGWGAGGVGLALSLLLVAGDPAHLVHAYLVAWLFFLTLGIGGLFFVLLDLVTRSSWGVAVRRLAEQVMGLLPFLALLFLPLALGLAHLYPWAGPDGGGLHLTAGKRIYLSSWPFLLRSALYLASWALPAWWLRRLSLAQDAADTSGPAATMRRASAPLLLLLAVTLTLASFDWIVSLDPEWYSTIFGVYLFAGAAMSVYALLAVLVVTLRRSGRLRQAVTESHLHDLGKLLFAFVVFWAYIAFSQYLLIWYAALPGETVWYARRLDPGWLWLTRLLAVGHFALPFALLLPRNTKRHAGALLGVSAWLLAMHYLDLYWLVMPELLPAPAWGLAEVATLLLVGGPWTALLARRLAAAWLIPRRDPRLPEALEHPGGP